ncbi:iron complex outermembrane recepter protein [Alysiella filiformis DSM 16848]|uniref:Iron complex outermembrane recepter protein n=2 Tax=Alysiella TaxID=194195 RepID=A0A286E8T0_9NEIS|nr:TonB-dependent siderophore receptor [Alysiella filiformis]QMT32444.1 TonB-dependent siderophore receptor [Alysiella filiformis]SOD67290.1 iron complex outermembrane recepter protein [Alysiella filiformis DSM 16848]
MKQKTLSTLSLAVWLALNSTAWANDVQQNDVQQQELDTVVVKSSGTMFKLGEVPFRQAKSAVALTAQQLQQEGVQKADELGRYQAGFTNQPFGSDTNTNWFRIRGAEATQAVNGLPAFQYGFFTPYTETFGVEAVEMTKGADAMTFGAANAGGLINYISKRANREQVGKGEIRANVGNRQQYGLAADYSGSLNADKSLRYRVVASARHAEGEWQDSDNRTLYIAPTLQWDIAPQTQLDILSSYQRDKGTPSSNFLPQEGTLKAFPDGSHINPRHNYGDPKNDTESNKQFSLGYELKHQFGKGVSFNSSYRYSNTQNFHRGAYLYPSAYAADWSPLEPSAAGYTLSRGVVFNDGKMQSHSADNRLNWQFKNAWLNNTLSAGVDYRRQKVDALYTLFGTTASTDLRNPSVGYGQNQDVSSAPRTHIQAEQLGFYLQNQARINKLITLGLGIRHDRAEQTEHTRTQKVKENHTSYSGSLMYHAPAGFNPYISYNESFRLPVGLGGNDVLYDPAITKQTEIGVKYLPKAVDGSLSVAAFRAKDKGALLSKDLGATVSNPSMVERKGAEIQADVNVLDNLNVGLAYTYLKSTSQDSTGNTRNPLLPKHTLALKTAYQFNEGKLNGLTLGAGMRHVGSSVSSQGSLYSAAKVPSSTMFDLMARYDFAKNWQAQINVDNVANKRHVSGCDYYCYYGQGRNVNASVSYKF